MNFWHSNLLWSALDSPRHNSSPRPWSLGELQLPLASTAATPFLWPTCVQQARWQAGDGDKAGSPNGKPRRKAWRYFYDRGCIYVKEMYRQWTLHTANPSPNPLPGGSPVTTMQIFVFFLWCLTIFSRFFFQLVSCCYLNGVRVSVCACRDSIIIIIFSWVCCGHRRAAEATITTTTMTASLASPKKHCPGQRTFFLSAAFVNNICVFA